MAPTKKKDPEDPGVIDFVNRIGPIITIIVACVIAHYSTRWDLESQIIGLRKDGERRDERNKFSDKAAMVSLSRLEASLQRLYDVVHAHTASGSGGVHHPEDIMNRLKSVESDMQTAKKDIELLKAKR